MKTGCFSVLRLAILEVGKNLRPAIAAILWLHLRSPLAIYRPTQEGHEGTRSLLPPGAKFPTDRFDGIGVEHTRRLGKQDMIFDLKMRLIEFAQTPCD